LVFGGVTVPFFEHDANRAKDDTNTIDKE